jgi:hypothetical protein
MGWVSFTSLQPSFSKVRDQPPILYQLMHKRWDGFCKIFFLPCLVEDLSCRQIHLNQISVLYLLGRLEGFEEGEPLVESIPVEDAGEALCDDARDPGCLQSQGSMFPGGTAAEILQGHENVSFFDFPDKFRSLILHRMFGQFSRIRLIEITGRDDRIGVNIGSKFPDSSFEFHG